MSQKKPLTRAEIVRQRRKQKEIRRAKRPAPPASQPTPTLPRRGVTLDASTQRVQPQARRVRIYETAAAAAPIASPLSEAHSPALPHVRVGWRLLSSFLVALFGTAIYLAWTLPSFRVSAATLAGNQTLSAEEVDAVLRLKGAPIFLVVPAEAEKALRLNFPEIVSVKVSVELPNKVIAAVTERQPVIRWEQNGAYAWVDAEGVAFRPRGEREGLVVVRASGSPPPGQKSANDPLAPVPYVAAEIVQSIRLLAPHVPPGSVLLYDPKFGLGWVDGRGWTVWFGSKPDQTDMKLRVYAALVDSLLQRGIAPTFINVAYPSAPYYRLGQ